MTFKKGLLAAATATTVAIAGTGIASAAPDELPDRDTAGSTSTSLEGIDLSDQAGGYFGSTDADGQFELGQAVIALGAAAIAGGAVAGSISILPNIYSAAQDFQGMVEDISGNLPPLPF